MFDSYNNKWNENLTHFAALPDVTIHEVTPDHEFIVLACDGIWDVLSSQEVVDFVRVRITQQMDPEIVSKLSYYIFTYCQITEIKSMFCVWQITSCIVESLHIGWFIADNKSINKEIYRWWWWWYGSCCLRNLKAKAITRRWDDSQYALLNSSVFRHLRNWGTVSAGSRTAAGSEFHSTRPETAKLRGP